VVEFIKDKAFSDFLQAKIGRLTPTEEAWVAERVAMTVNRLRENPVRLLGLSLFLWFWQGG
jgi:hypothetical protein